MHLTELTNSCASSSRGDANPDIKGLTQDSRLVHPGWLFAALPGTRFDGSQFVEDAVQHGAVAVLASDDTLIPDDVVFVTAKNPRHVLSLMAAKFYGTQPAVIAAVTGTNGKTSTVYFAQQLWQALDLQAVSLGTLGVQGAGIKQSGTMTTPDPVLLHAELADLAGRGVTHLALEASSHGLHQNRLDGVKVTAAGFTNLSRDHLDYHVSMEDYFAAKVRLFTDILRPEGVAVLNADIPEFNMLKTKVREKGNRIFSYGEKGKNIRLVKQDVVPGGQAIEIEIGHRVYALTLPLVGTFQVMNALCALGLVMAGNEASTEKIVAALMNLKGAPGRLEVVPGHPVATVYVDYAHTPDALETVLKALRPYAERRLICLAGCGGDRDTGKRPMMGRIASDLSDLVVITDDNPRTEDPASIRSAMMAAAAGAKEIGNRRDAIQWAVRDLKEGDVLVIAGKGHEQGQIIGETIEPFDDVEEARKAIALIGKGT